ncbi:MAG: hypothetical protein V4577_22840 [Bacteroidota bacterium]
MNSKQFLVVLACLLVCSTSIFGQAVNVDPLTGAGRVAIPVYTFSKGQVTFPVTLVYSGNGVRTKDVEGTAGIGWNLLTGGMISRTLRGLPDDGSADNSSNARYGWMHTSNTAVSYITGIDDNVGNCTNETSDLSYISSHFPITMDTEPDIFNVNAPGLSCQLIFDRTLATPAFRPIGYQDLKISYTTSGTKITSFTITNDKGITYLFDVPESASLRTASTGTPKYFTTKYQQYQNGINYYDAWYLSKITDANGMGVQLAYTTGTTTRNSSDPITLFLAGSSTATPQYTVRSSVTPKTLYTVSTIDDDLITVELTFNWTSSSLSGGGTDQMYISSVTGLNKNLLFGYSPVKYVTAGGANYYRQFLRSYMDTTDPNSPVNYTFAYYGETQSSGNYTTTLPDSSSFKVDYWGYYAPNGFTSLQPAVYINPSNSSYPRFIPWRGTATSGSDYIYFTAGNNYSPDTANTKVGSLNVITNAAGAPTTIRWESNNYYDPETGTVLPGAGVRVQAVKYVPGYGSPAYTINYSYNSPSTGVSSGKPISLPQFAFTFPYGGGGTGSAPYTNSTAISPVDLSNDDHSIVYQFFKTSQTGSGYTLYEFNQPATYFDLTAHPGCSGCSTNDWAPTVDMIARHNCASSYGFIKNDMHSYPFIPDPNYGFEQGLLHQVTTYTEGGTHISSQDTYTYQRSNTMGTMYGFRYEDNPNGTLDVTNYNKYAVNYGTSELTTIVSKNVYNSSDYSTVKNTTQTITYGSAYHKLPTQIDLNNSDGNTVSTKITYTKDFPSAGSGTNPNVTAIYNLNQQNVNIPVETIRQTTRSGSTYITGGSLTYFKSFSGAASFNLPSQQWQLVAPDGILSSSFSPFAASGSGSSQTISQNINYQLKANFTDYDYTADLLTANDNNHSVVTTANDHISNKPYFVAKNAGVNEIGFQDFDSYGYIGCSSSGTGGASIASGGHGNSRYYSMPSTLTFTRSITKSGLSSIYIFSLWANGTNGTGYTVNVKLNGGTAIPCAFTGTGAWKYYEFKIAVGAMPTTFTFAYTPAQTTSIDDVLIYPDNAEVATMCYDITTHHKIMQTDTNGISVYYQTDRWGRILYIRDQDNNIIQRNKYTISLFE